MNFNKTHSIIQEQHLSGALFSTIDRASFFWTVRVGSVGGLGGPANKTNIIIGVGDLIFQQKLGHSTGMGGMVREKETKENSNGEFFMHSWRDISTIPKRRTRR